MKYKRLTGKSECGYNTLKACFNCDLEMDCGLCPHWAKALDRLSEIEDKIEQGTLIELNDKLIGESVYGIQQDTSGKYWFDSDENTLLGFTSNGIVTWNDVHGYNDWFKNGFWFFTREEAEKRLKELQE